MCVCIILRKKLFCTSHFYTRDRKRKRERRKRKRERRERKRERGNALEGVCVGRHLISAVLDRDKISNCFSDRPTSAQPLHRSPHGATEWCHHGTGPNKPSWLNERFVIFFKSREPKPPTRQYNKSRFNEPAQ